MLDWIRSQLLPTPTISTPFGPRRVTYADFIASGRPLRFVEEAIAQRVLPFYANTHTEDSALGARMTHFTHEASAYIKRCLGADTRYKLAFCGTGATGAIKRMQEILGISVPSTLRASLISTLAPEQRPVVFVGPYEHHSNEVSWRETIAEVVEIPLDAHGLLDLAALDSALADPLYAKRLKIGSFSAASNVTGLLTDTRAVARLMHAHGGIACFDFAAAAPYVEIDVKPGEPDGYDAIFLSPHKFLGGPGTPGVLLFHQRLYQLAAPSTAGGGTVRYVSAWTHHYIDDVETREDAGTPAILQKLRAALAFWVKEQVGVAAIEAREAALIRTAITRLRNHPRIELLGNLEAPRLAILSFMVKGRDRYLHPRLVVRLLNDLFGIQARGGCACAGPYGHALLNMDVDASARYLQAILSGYEGVKPGWTRLSFNYFIDEAEFAFLLQAIEFIADYGERFLPLYTFDWRTGGWSHASDAPQPSLFDALSAQPPSEGPVPYPEYLDAALAWAHVLPEAGDRPIPAEVPKELVYFRV